MKKITDLCFVKCAERERGSESVGCPASVCLGVCDRQ